MSRTSYFRICSQMAPVKMSHLQRVLLKSPICLQNISNVLLGKSSSLSTIILLILVFLSETEAYESQDVAKTSENEKYGSDLDNSIYHTHVQQELIPSFAGPIQNVTVNVGREAVLECPVNSLGQYKVGWLKAKDQTILALHTRVITHNGRIAVDHEESRIWKLKIRQVQESDRGCYMCQLNTAEMKKQIGCIDVLIPPDIDDRQTSSDVIVNEGDDADLICKANGHPRPTIEWYREDKTHINVLDLKLNYSRRLTVDRYTGEILRLKKVQRQQMGAYLCIASNNVPPAVSKRIILNVNFAPEITVPSQLFGVAPGTDVTFSCMVQAYPPAINYWMKNESEMLLNGGPKYNITEVQVSSYERIMYISVINWQKSDQSQFSCISTNSLGKADGRIQSYTYIPKVEIEENSQTYTAEKQKKVANDPAEPKRPAVTNEVDLKIIADYEHKVATQNENNRRKEEALKNTNLRKNQKNFFASNNAVAGQMTSHLIVTINFIFIFLF